jgi:hypothetical protein
MEYGQTERGKSNQYKTHISADPDFAQTDFAQTELAKTMFCKSGISPSARSLLSRRPFKTQGASMPMESTQNIATKPVSSTCQDKGQLRSKLPPSRASHMPL